MGGKIEKSHGGAPPGPRGSAPASVRRFAPLSGLRSAPRARRCAPVWFLNFTTHRENKVKILSKKVRDTQANPSYSAKNNVAIRMIATFMPTYLSLFTGEIHDREGDSYFIPAFTKYSYFISTHLSMLVVHSGVYSVVTVFN